jgi:UDP-N-acetylmuramyl pentapeptide phosphotransferase/UDP-N-acetylglucosamine-1-phosphate transferase
MRILAIVLIVVGALMLAYPVISFTERDTVVDIGPIEVTEEDTHSLPIPPILGGIAIAAGVVLLVTGRKRLA